MALLFCDVDGLKEVNDNFGHDAGDRALVSVAEVLSLVALDFPEALVSRIGGDEFCVVLPGNGSEAARRFAEEASRLLGEDHPPAVTLSTGAASLALGAQTAADLFRAADAAQYAAKRGGRGRIVVAADSRARRLGEQTARGRRSLRDRHASELQRQLGVTTALLDEVLTRAPALERLEAVAVGLAETLDAAEWAVSCASAGGTRLSVMRGQYRRGAAGESAGRFEFGDGEDAYPLADFPATAAIVARGGAFVVDAENPLADEAEVAFLEEWGYTAMLAAAAADETGVYVVELFADDRTRELATAKAQLRLLVLAAVQGAGAGVRF